MISRRKRQENSLRIFAATRWFAASLIAVVSLFIGIVGWIDSGFAEQENAAKPQVVQIQSEPNSEPPFLLKLNGEAVDTKGLVKRLKAVPKPERHVILVTEEAIPLGEVTAVLDLAKQAGVETVKLGRADLMTVAGLQGDASAGEDLPLVKKLKAITIPSIEFVGTPLGDAVAFLVHRSRERDPASAINVILGEGMKTRPITLRLENASLADALRFSAELAGAHITLEDHAVLIGSKEEGHGSQDPRVLSDLAAAKKVNDKLEQIVIPAIEFVDTPLVHAIDFLRARAAEIDSASPPGERGVNIVLSVPPDSKEVKLTLKLSNVPLGEALKYTVKLTRLEMEVQGNAVVVLSPKKSD